ncbi:MAG: MFS transporter, partial [Solobacterium sp.]|nr:MFS transporter [Solobacterium sp.]
MTVLLLVVIYLAFISLGLPDSLLGSAWPSMYVSMGSTITGAGTLAMLISACTIISSLMADRIL